MDDGVPIQWLTPADVRMRRASYAQNFEDILLRRALPNPTGFYIDVGANHPVYHSVTKLFYDDGWHGINIEPSPPLHRLLAADRGRDINLNLGVADEDGSLTFYEVADHRHGWSSFHPNLAKHYRSLNVEVLERTIPVSTLARVCEQYVGDRTIDFLKVDAECFEFQVLRGADWERWRPRVVVVEAGLPNLLAEWEPYLLAQRYELAASDGVNRYYVAREESDELRDAFRAPVNVLDGALSFEVVRLVDELERQNAALAEGLGEQERQNAALAARLDELERQILEMDFGPVVLDTLRGARDFVRRHPRLRALARRTLRRAG